MSAEKLYTPQMLAAAITLADYPPLPDAPAHGEARSTTCGSIIAMDLSLGANDRISELGMTVRACAVGQAAAAIFAKHALGCSLSDIERTSTGLKRWLDGEGELPSWPDLAMIAPARDFPARHGAMILPWNAAMSALSSARASS